MSRTIVIVNRQQVCWVNVALLRRAGLLLAELLKLDEFELGVSLVEASEMATLNESFLQHKGPTDVITFDYAEPSAETPAGKQRPGRQKPQRSPERVHGEIFICIDEAQSQARRFRTIWQEEVARYLIHGVLHLCGYNDQQRSARRQMKRAEDGLLRQLGKALQFRKLGNRRKTV